MIRFVIELVLPLVFISLLIYVSINQYRKEEEWRSKFKEGIRVYTTKEEDGVVVCIKGNKAFVKFFHGSYWRYLDDLVPYNEYLD